MKQELNKEELVARYVHAIHHRLGHRAPKDLAEELRSLLAESIEARELSSGGSITAAETAGILRDFGSPEEVAQRYVPKPDYLIGPDLYPIFITVAKTLLGVAAGIPLLLLVISRMASSSPSPTFGRELLDWVGLSYQIAFGGLGWCVLVFAVLERLGTGATARDQESWDPFALPAVDDPSAASRLGAAVRIYGAVALMVLFNFYPDWLGLYIFSSGKDPIVLSLQTLGIRLPMFALNLWWLITIVKNLWLWKTQRWNPILRVMEFGLGLYGAAILYVVVNWNPQDALRTSLDSALAGSLLAGFLSRLLPQILIVALLMTLAASAWRLFRLVRPVKAA